MQEILYIHSQYKLVMRHIYGFRPVGQGNYDKLCWAATVASISNAYRGVYDKTAVSVAQTEFGSTNFNQEIGFQGNGRSARTVLLRYDFNYMYYTLSYNDSDFVNIAYQNISNGYPIYAHFEYGIFAKAHAVAIYGASITGNYLTVMDPAGSGSNYSVYYRLYPYSDYQYGYYYISASNGEYMYLKSILGQYNY